jgi:alkylated DNA repair protein alkB family protein 1
VDPHDKNDPRRKLVRYIDDDEFRAIVQVEGHPPGFFIITGALDEQEQLHWAQGALEEYSTAEHTNLTNLKRLKGEHDVESLGDVEHLWKSSIAANDDFRSFEKLRWASLGYHYNWTDRMYERSLVSTFPPPLADLCSRLAACVDERILAEAAIVNYYPVGSYMSGHIDDAEQAMEEPIVSVSVGCPAIFLLGGRSKSDVPVPIVVRSGDVLIMSGESRYCYHGVPAVMDHATFPLNADMNTGRSDNCCKMCVDHGAEEAAAEMHKYHHIRRYLRQGRININCRRVARADGVWVNKCGSGATRNSMRRI